MLLHPRAKIQSPHLHRVEERQNHPQPATATQRARIVSLALKYLNRYAYKLVSTYDIMRISKVKQKMTRTRRILSTDIWHFANWKNT